MTLEERIAQMDGIIESMGIGDVMEQIRIQRLEELGTAEFTKMLNDTRLFSILAMQYNPKKFRGDTLQLWYDIIAAFHSINYEAITVRGVYYRVVSTAYRYPKTEKTYKKIQRVVLEMRRCGFLPYEWITDESRTYRYHTSYGSREEFLNSMSRNYRRNLWEHSDYECEVWIEKNAMTSIIYPITYQYDVKLYPLGGFSSETAIWAACESFKSTDKQVKVLYLTDYDSSGLDMLGQVQDGLTRFGVDNVTIERIAVTPKQILDYNLPTRPDKKTGGDACELDAFKPKDIRDIVESSITQYLDMDEVNRLKEIEKIERDSFNLLNFDA